MIYSQGTPSGTATESIKTIAAGTVGPLPLIVLVWIGLTLLVSVGLHATRGGRYLFAVGENPTVTGLSGIDNDSVLIIAYALCGLAAGVTGILFTGFSTMSFLGMGDQFVLPAIASVVLGGTSIFGGRGSYIASALAAIFLTVLSAKRRRAGRLCAGANGSRSWRDLRLGLHKSSADRPPRLRAVAGGNTEIRKGREGLARGCDPYAGPC